MRAGKVGELVAAQPFHHGDVADREDAPVAAVQTGVDRDPPWRVDDPRSIQTEALDVRPAAGGDQQVRAADRGGAATLRAILRNGDGDGVALARHLFHVDAFMDLDRSEAPTY